MKGNEMWILVIWAITANGIIPDSTLLAVSQSDCQRMQRVVNERIVAIPNQVVGATCVYSDMPSVSRS